ncbi:hypothetical protein [Bradyrhizobium sp. CB2312]|uniref:hypothetical protein n=1 Tax=Bradyrhizobium sp. CB2312 TaxID=3039155 RepID=UPI0024B0565A|nr:hypothetical protein [Bradyrhizobium sp. CB2312]WFU75530.1 hypothetical protein QA642_16755 [Bradyrhizobium sp. CB2312]
MSHKLIVLPDDTIDSIRDPINSAKRSLNIRMFLFTDPTLLKAVIAAQQLGFACASCSTRPAETARAKTKRRANC